MPPRHACDVCYKRKIRCLITGPEGACDWCSNQAIPCTFLRKASQRKGDKSALVVKDRVVRDLAHRVEQLEDQLAQATPRASTFPHGAAPFGSRRDLSERPGFSVTNISRDPIFSSLPAASRSVVPFSPSKEPATSNLITNTGLGLERVLWFKGFPILSDQGEEWIAAKSGEESMAVNKLLQFHSMVGLHWSTPAPPHWPISSDTPETLPEERETRGLLHYFHHSLPELIYPMLDIVLFEETIKSAYLSSNSQPAQIPAEACVWAFYAVISRKKDVRGFQLRFAGDVYAAKAQSMLGHVISYPCADSLQAVLMLEAYRSSMFQSQSASLLLSVACRMVCTIGGHLIKSPQCDPGHHLRTEDPHDHVRALFWLCYTLDKAIALRFGQPPLLTSDYCDLRLPVLQASCEDGEERPFNGFMRRLPVDPGLGTIKEKICRLVCLPSGTDAFDSQLLLSIRQLDNEVEQWRLSIPQTDRPTLVDPGDVHHRSAPHIQQRPNLPYIRLQLDYHYILAIIHSTVRKCGAEIAEGEPLPENLHSVIHSSIDLTLETGRSTLKLLENALKILEEDALWYIYHYAPLAVMSLFVNILTHPLASRARGDLDILSEAIGTIRSSLCFKLLDDDTVRLQRLCEFMIELVRLGSSAIWNARRTATA